MILNEKGRGGGTTTLTRQAEVLEWVPATGAFPLPVPMNKILNAVCFATSSQFKTVYFKNKYCSLPRTLKLYR